MFTSDVCQEIFSHLPAHRDLLSASLVCRDWNNAHKHLKKLDQWSLRNTQGRFYSTFYLGHVERRLLNRLVSGDEKIVGPDPYTISLVALIYLLECQYDKCTLLTSSVESTTKLFNKLCPIDDRRSYLYGKRKKISIRERGSKVNENEYALVVFSNHDCVGVGEVNQCQQKLTISSLECTEEMIMDEVTPCWYRLFDMTDRATGQDIVKKCLSICEKECPGRKLVITSEKIKTPYPTFSKINEVEMCQAKIIIFYISSFRHWDIIYHLLPLFDSFIFVSLSNAVFSQFSPSGWLRSSFCHRHTKTKYIAYVGKMLRDYVPTPCHVKRSVYEYVAHLPKSASPFRLDMLRCCSIYNLSYTELALLDQDIQSYLEIEFQVEWARSLLGSELKIKRRDNRFYNTGMTLSNAWVRIDPCADISSIPFYHCLINNIFLLYQKKS